MSNGIIFELTHAKDPREWTKEEFIKNRTSYSRTGSGGIRTFDLIYGKYDKWGIIKEEKSGK